MYILDFSVFRTFREGKMFIDAFRHVRLGGDPGRDNIYATAMLLKQLVENSLTDVGASALIKNAWRALKLPKYIRTPLTDLGDGDGKRGDNFKASTIPAPQNRS